MSRFDDLFQPNNKGYGMLKFTKRGFDTTDKAEALLGRSVALYDFMMDFKTDLRVLSDTDVRASKFKEICIWVDSSDARRIRNAFSAICRDYPGKGIASIADPSLDIGKVEWWYEWEYSALCTTKRMGETFAALFGVNKLDTAQALKVPFKVVNLVLGYSELPAEDFVEVFEYAEEVLLAMADWNIVLNSDYDEETVYPFRELFVQRWIYAEDALISVSPTHRREVKLNG